MMKKYLSDSLSLSGEEDFRFNILYTDPSPNYITEDGWNAPFPPNPTPGNQLLKPLLKVFNLDKLNYNNDPQTGVMVFDFVQGITVDSQNGRLIFTTNHLGNYFSSNTGSGERCSTYNPNQKKYVFRNMYRIHNRCRTVKNKFLLGKYKSTR
jgi:cell surface protein SprA